jgi:hypothetical protein
VIIDEQARARSESGPSVVLDHRKSGNLFVAPILCHPPDLNLFVYHRNILYRLKYLFHKELLNLYFLFYELGANDFGIFFRHPRRTVLKQQFAAAKFTVENS